MRQFTLRRLLLAMVAFALPLGCFARFGSLAVVLPALAASSGAFSLILIAKGRDTIRIIYSVLFGGLGAFIGTPLISNPGYGPAEAMWHGVVGIMIGWLIGCGVVRLDERFAMHDDKRSLSITGEQRHDD